MIQIRKFCSLTFIVAVLTVGCTSPKPIYYSSGKDAHILSCTGATWSGCLRDAGLTCQEKGYEILEKTSGREYGFFYDNTVKEMVISCGLPSPAVTPQAETKPLETPSTSVKLGELGTALPPETAPARPAKVKPVNQTPVEPDTTGLLIKQ
jgi:hypothetical protein